MTEPPHALDIDEPDEFSDQPESGGVHVDGADGHDPVDGVDGAAILPGGAGIEPVDELRRALQSELSTDTTQHYLNQIGARALFTAAEEVHFATLAKAGDFGARQTMIEHNLRLVVSIA